MSAYYFGLTNIRFLSTNIGILFCFCSKVGFLYTNIGILFLFYQHCIALHQYQYIIFCWPMLDSSIALLVNYFPFTNTGFIYTNISILFFFTNVGFLFTNIGISSCFTNVGSLFTNVAIFVLFCQCWVYNTLPTLVCHLLITKINQKYANKNKLLPNIGILNFFQWYHVQQTWRAKRLKTVVLHDLENPPHLPKMNSLKVFVRATKSWSWNIC